MPDHEQPSARDTGTLGKALAVLEIVADSDGPMRFTDILEKCDQPRGTLHRQLSNLVSEGLLSVNPDRSYALGIRLLKFASQAWAGNEFRAVAEPHLRALQQVTGETVHLGVLRGTEVIYLDKVEGRQAVRMYSQIGNASPAYCTGVGKAAMSQLAPSDFEALAARTQFHRFTEHTLTGTKALADEVKKIRASGIAYDREEHEPGIHCVAAPIPVGNTDLLAAVSVTGPAYRVSDEMLESWADTVKQTANAIARDVNLRMGPR